MDYFDTYRKMFTSTTNEDVCWWYCGAVFKQIEGLGEVPMSQAETLMAFKTESLSPDAIKITWREIGYFRDLATGEIVTAWHNPFTGNTEVRSKSFVDGPAEYTVTRKADGVQVELTQSHARIKNVSLVTTVANGQISLVQTEDKKRSYARPDGSWPDVDSPEASEIRTVLAIYGSAADVADPAKTNVRAGGYYHSGSSIKDGPGAWGKSVVKGVMQKARADEKLNPIAWQRLKQIYPEFFKGDRASPNW